LPSVEKISIALPPEMVAQLRQAVETGAYASSSEVVRDALRDWTRKRQMQQNGIAELRELWQQARTDSTPGVPVDDLLDRLERKYQALADPAGTKEIMRVELSRFIECWLQCNAAILQSYAAT
jgi:antitoxin ParD1/3/4